MTLQEQIDFILGPQALIGTSWFDRTQVERGKFWGNACPSVPPPPESLDAYVMLNYYDLPYCLYVAHKRTGDPVFLDLARKCADAWWKHPWIDEGRKRPWPDDISPSPRHAGVGGLILRALDGRPEMFDWINAYSRFSLDHWCKNRVNSSALFYGVREGAFALHFGIWLAAAHPDSTIRAQYLADCEFIATQYFGRLQRDDGSWRWNDPDETEADGGTLVGITQPFMVGLLLCALIDLHRLSTNETVKTNIQNQITKSCRHLYGSTYMTQLVPSLNVKRRGFQYYYHGGTTTNPTKYENGNYPANWDTNDPSGVQNARQPIGTIIAAFGYAFKLTGDPYFKAAGDELWDSAYGETDKIRNYMAGDGKSYNQNCRRAGSYLAFTGTVVEQPAPLPTEPVPSTPTALTPSPDGFKGEKIIDSRGDVWTFGPDPDRLCLKNGTRFSGGGAGTLYKYVSQVVYVLGLNDSWWKLNQAGTSWEPVAGEPGVVQPAPEPTSPITTTPVTRKVAWPKSEASQESVLNLQWAERFRLKTPKVSGDYAIFEKVI